MTERHVCLAPIAEERGKVFEASRTLETLMHSACVASGKTLFSFLAHRTRRGTIVSLSRLGEIRLVYTCTPP